MAEYGVTENEFAEGEIDLDHIFDDIPEDLINPSPISDPSNSSPDSLSLSIGEIERLLMQDGGDKVAVDEQPILDGFWSDFLLDSPVESDHRSADLVDKNSNPSSSSSSSSVEKHDKVDVLQQKENDNNSGGDGDDPVISKKHQRQLRNRTAAVRSRERKKMYVRDLELKSKYLEGECRRLGMLLQCCFAENQALRLSLQNTKAFDASMTKQESAVLLLESLLLGSLLWFLGIVCLLILPTSLQLNLVTVPPENVGVRKQGSLAPRKAESKIFGLQLFHSFMVSKRCKASRSRMKPRRSMMMPSSLILQV